ncbi:MAG: 3-isopropylmalate dehydratase small subunit [Rhodospirillaceae bacterium]
MQPFTTVTAVAAPLDLANVDTDKILPARFLRKPRDPGYDRWLFHDMRLDGEGRERPEFILNQAPYRGAKILVAGTNFGCGSSREGAVYALLDAGIKVVIAPSFGEIHYANEIQNGMLPAIVSEGAGAKLREFLHQQPGAQLTVDLPAQTIAAPDGTGYRFDIEPVNKERLLKGLDDVGLVLQHLPEIEAYEAKRKAEMPWL